MTDDGKIDPEKHASHHHWIDEEIEANKKCRENRSKILNHVLGWGIIGLITAIGAFTIKGFKGAIAALFL